MLGQSKLLTILSDLAKQTKADGVSVTAHATTRRVFRFAYDAIHQNVNQEQLTITVKAINDHRVGVASTNTLQPENLKRAAAKAIEIARHRPQQKQLPDLPSKHQISSKKDYVSSTIKTDPKECVGILKQLFYFCKGVGASLAGSMVIGDDEFAVCNSSGVTCYNASTVAGVKLITMHRGLSGFASASNRHFDKLDFEGLLRDSLKQSLRQEKPITLPLGSYEVILEPEAIAELVNWMAYTAFGAKSVEDGHSFLTGKTGKKICDTSISIYDDANEPDALRIPFDFEGTPKQKVFLIEKGIAKDPVYDSLYGLRAGRASTGHAVGADEPEGPFPLHLGIAPGNSNTEDMIRSCKRGLIIPRFHYVNGLLNPPEALMTGLTHEGTCLIENGKITRPITTMRFTQSILQALNNTIAISKQRKLVADTGQELGCAVMPSLHLKSFRFTGRSKT